MRAVAKVTAELKRRGELWEPAPGLVALRGDVARLRTAIDGELRALCAAESAEEWSTPPAMPFDTLARADYFASFPQWLTAAAHLDADDDALAAIAEAHDTSAAAVAALRPVAVALQPAVCYHVYSACAGRSLAEPYCCSVAGTCWRHEVGRFAPLERGWSFTMREIVRIGDAEATSDFLSRGIQAAIHLAQRLDLNPRTAQASDPFFAPSTRGRALLQRIRALKHELLLPLGDGRTVAAASFNDHADFFGTAFDIRLVDGRTAATSCVAFGLERWLLAVLVQHGPDAHSWPFDVAAPSTGWSRAHATRGRTA